MQFETIHPFLDGNGRAGRLLIALMLHHGGVLRQPLLYLSLYFKQHRDDYYRLLDTVRLDGDWEAWIEFFLEGTAETASSAVTNAQRLLGLFEQDERRVQSASRGASSALRAFAALRVRPITTLNDPSKRVGISFPTASKAIETLAGLGIVQELTGCSRNRVFAYDRYLAILAEGTEPI